LERIFSHKALSTKRGTIMVGIGAALMAAVVLLVYLSQYRASLNDANRSVSVLVAKRLIEKGTPGSYIGSAALFATTTIRKGELASGAISDPAVFRGQVAVADIYPGQQLTAGDFAPSALAGVKEHLALDKRAIAIPLDAAHGNLGQIQAGDRVDVFAGFNVRGFAGGGGDTQAVLKLLMPNALVLSAPATEKGGIGSRSSSNVILRANYQQAAELAFAADNGKIWLVLRPTANAAPTPPELVTIETILFGIKPVTASRRVRNVLAGVGG
jgi:Flp pilus assembly protein CpaB